MAICIETGSSANVGIGQVAIARQGGTLKTVVGSCIGVVLYHPRIQLGALGHIVLPRSAGRQGHATKYADTAIPFMIQKLESEGARPSGIVAKIAGGASLFAASGAMQIGSANIEAVIQALQTAKICLAAKHVGGLKGRRITFDSATGELKIEFVGHPSEIL